MDAIRVEKENPIINTILDRFSAAAQPFCPGRFSAKFLGNSSQRSANLIGGWSYTSEAYPWPKTFYGPLFMQPMFQLELTNVGQLLKVYLGAGLLQGWGPSFKDFDTVREQNDDPFLIRFIPGVRFT